MKWFGLLAVVFAMLLFASAVVYADDPPDESDVKVDIGIDGDLEVQIKVSGPAEVNVGVEGPAEVHIDAGDEVRLSVQASDESQVFTDNPARSPDDSSATYLPVVSGAVGLCAFFLIRRRVKNKGDNDLAKPREVRK